jgi:hypothetical protein
MSHIFRLEMLAGREGDCLVLAYGNPRRPRRVMIDGGRAATYRANLRRFADLTRTERTFELLVISHVDRDHIEGALRMLDDPAFPITFRDIWFNGYDHLQDADLETFGAIQGERLSALLLERRLPWNAAFRQRSVEIARAPRPIRLAGGLTLRLLSPDRAKLESLVPRWEKECRAAGLIPGAAARRPPAPEGFERMGPIDIEQLAATPFVPDRTPPNGASIVVLAEYRGRRILLGADSHADLLARSLQSLADADGGRLRLDAFKLPHHGSRYNVSRELLELVDCRRYLVSTNGSYFGHPHPEAMARVIAFGGTDFELVFNYRSDPALIWDNPAWQDRYGYRTTYPLPALDGEIAIEL